MAEAHANVRERLETLIATSGYDFTSLSRALGRNPAYIQQYIRRGVPKKLDEEARRHLAELLEVDERELGAPAGRAVVGAQGRSSSDYLLVPYFTGIGASAGAGALTPDGEEAAETALALQMRWVREICGGDPDLLSVIKVQGDSMLPTLGDGDPILVDRSDGFDRLRDGIYVMRADDALLVKRVTRTPRSRVIHVTSDNRDYPNVGDCDVADVDVIGRVIWVGRQLR
ncbi:MAG: S24 family peptidase [Pacificimonas sp.]